ncbi:uncharacterized protein LOC126842712 isoform X2 [Adelges cooleyi]|nr:uncharacterized protein LOC126842712 isoform X2 [Adelges cooleyi]XP_050435782.1 uncharacterized protein LOC126842712 isoform X2 [Adelges cooleyi]
MALMRFINVIADISGKGPQKSMYARAASIELPHWLINLRHKISHDQELPAIEELRAAIEFLLEWLQTKYWNVDENFQIATPNLNMDVINEFTDLIDFYVLNRTSSKDPTIMEKLNVARQKLLSESTLSNDSKMYKNCVKKIKLLLSDRASSSMLINVFCTRYLLHSQKHKIAKNRISGLDKITWSVLLKVISNLGLLTNLLQCLVVQESLISALWVVELCTVLFKSSEKRNCNHDQFDDCFGDKRLTVDASIILKSAVKSPHKYTIVFLKWLMRLQVRPLNTSKQIRLLKLISMYTGSVKYDSNLKDHIYTVDDLIKKKEVDQEQSPWSLAVGQINWQQTPLGTSN